MSGERGAVVITGASTGIGNATAAHLKELGFRAFGGVRKPEDAERLRSEGVEPLMIDVTDGESIAAAAAQVEQEVGEKGLAGLVNNAGVAETAPLELLPIERLRSQIEVNLVGQVAVTKALLPSLRRGPGRIVNITSIGGLAVTPGVGAYSASKFGMEAITDALRQELHPFGIWVAAIEPGAIATPIWDRGVAAADSIVEEAPPDKRELYDRLIERMRVVAADAGKRGIPPQRVAEKVAHALTASRPKPRYIVGRDARIRAKVISRLPERAQDALVRRFLKL
jgi:NAD(P)-dependent dehydrogenase (short-subunit alcohol dehydrogenase family)